MKKVLGEAEAKDIKADARIASAEVKVIEVETRAQAMKEALHKAKN